MTLQMKEDHFYERFLGQKIIMDRVKQKAILYKTFHSLSEKEKEHWPVTHGKPIQTLREGIMERKAEIDVDISKGKLERYLLNKGASLKEIKKLDSVSMTELKETTLNMKRGITEVTFASASILEGMFELFGITTQKAVERYKDQVHAIKTEKGNYLGKINHNGSMNMLTSYLSEKELNERLEEFHSQRKEYSQTLSLKCTQKKEE